MEFISLFFSSFLSFFLIGHLLYAISGRNKKVALIVFGLFFVFAMYDWIKVLLLPVEIQFILLYFLARVGPAIMAFLVFARFTGIGKVSINTRKVKRLLPQKAYDVFTTKENDVKNALLMLFGSVLVLASYFIIELGLLLYILMFSGVLGIGLSLYLLFSLLKIKSEKIILIIGKQKDRFFETDINKKDFKLRFKIKDYFKNSDYIVDPLAMIYLQAENKSIEKHHVFWIATNDEVPMAKEDFSKLSHLPYKEHLEVFKKYEFRQITFKVSGRHTLDIVKNQRIR